jgi:hypothetical protein
LCLLFVGFLLLLSSQAFAAIDQALFSKEVNRIDQLLEAGLSKNGIKPNAPVSDGTFLRRAYLDISGRIPTFEEASAFLEDSAAEKRSQLVSDLIESKGYVHHYFHFWSDLLRHKTRINNNTPGTDLYGQWIKDCLAENKPYDAFVKELLLAEGHAFETPQVGFYTRDQGMPLDHMANTVQVFLGTRIQCAQCHNHPFDKWTQQDFYGMAAFTYGVKNKGHHEEFSVLPRVAREIKREARFDPQARQRLRRTFRDLVGPINVGAFDSSKPLRLPKDYQYDDASPRDKVTPKPLFGVAGDAAHPRGQFAAWMTSPDNERFTTVIANRLWKSVMGLGLIEPADDFTDDTKASHPDLLKSLEALLVRHDYDIKYFLRVLHHTQAYQREATIHEDIYEPCHFPGPVLRRMSAEQVWDSLMTLMISDVDHYQPPLSGELKKWAAYTSAVKQRADAVKAMSVSELKELVLGQADVFALYAEKRTAIVKVKNEATSKDEMRKANQQLRRLNTEYKQGVDSMFGASMDADPMMMSADTPQPPVDRMERRTRKRDGMRRGRKERTLNAQFARASELPSPMHAGHFLREFGQSDRNVIDNADASASIPQALAMMNHWFYGPLLGRSALRDSLNAAATMDEKLERLFVSIRSREPSERERELLASARMDSGRRAIPSVMWSLLNTREFLFIQ